MDRVNILVAAIPVACLLLLIVLICLQCHSNRDALALTVAQIETQRMEMRSTKTGTETFYRQDGSVAMSINWDTGDVGFGSVGTGDLPLKSLMIDSSGSGRMGTESRTDLHGGHHQYLSHAVSEGTG